MRKIGPVLTQFQAETSFDKTLRNNAVANWRKRVWTIQNESGKQIGVLMLKRNAASSADAEIGIMLLPEANGKGLAKVALGGLVDYAFRHLGLQRIEAIFDCTHLATRKLVKSIGFVLSPNYLTYDGRTCCTATITLCERNAVLQP